MNGNDEWLLGKNHSKWKEDFNEHGYLVVEDLLNPNEVEEYRVICDDLLSGRVDASSHRHDLGSHVKRKDAKIENICQIMWPSQFVKNLDHGILHKRAQRVAQLVLGTDMSFDFDMLISKAPHTDTITPMHQDESYWLDMPDKRAVTIWVTLDDTTLDNGCMWFLPGSHKEKIRPHRPAAEGHHVLCCVGEEAELVPVPIRAGSCTLHHGRTIHYTRGNSTDEQRRAYILNYRPKTMVQWERDHGFDHGKEGLKSIFEDDDKRR